MPTSRTITRPLSHYFITKPIVPPLQPILEDNEQDDEGKDEERVVYTTSDSPIDNNENETRNNNEPNAATFL